MKYQIKARFPFKENDLVSISGHCVRHGMDCGEFKGHVGPILSNTFVIQQKRYDKRRNGDPERGDWHQYTYSGGDISPLNSIENNEQGLILLIKEEP